MSNRITPTAELKCLAYNPFQGDETDVKLMRDRFLVTRETHKCNICWDEISANTRVRARSEINRETRQAGTFYFCPACCLAMSMSWRDNGRAIEDRTSIGMKRAGAFK